MKQTLKRNMMVFEAPIELSSKAKYLADTKMISTSAICRQALQQYLNHFDVYNKTEKTAETRTQ
jgi:predicted transcriptional regulator